MQDSQTSHTHSSIYVSGWLWERVDQYNARPKSVSCVCITRSCCVQFWRFLWGYSRSLLSTVVMQGWVSGVSSYQLWSKHHCIRECCSVLCLRMANKFWYLCISTWSQNFKFLLSWLSSTHFQHHQNLCFFGLQFTLLKNLITSQCFFVCSLKQCLLAGFRNASNDAEGKAGRYCIIYLW